MGGSVVKGSFFRVAGGLAQIETEAGFVSGAPASQTFALSGEVGRSRSTHPLGLPQQHVNSPERHVGPLLTQRRVSGQQRMCSRGVS